MTDVQIVRKLQKLVIAYQNAEAYVEVEIRIGTGFRRMKQIDRDYRKFCDMLDLYNRLSLPYHINDIFKYVLLLDDIMNGTIFDM